MRQITVVYPFYKNLGILAEHQAIWSSWPVDARASLHVIVVDDGSPKGSRPSEKHLTVQGMASLRLYRIYVDIRWNWLACRNIGVDQARTDWVLLTDIDHVIKLRTLRRLTQEDLDPSCVYRLSRVDAPHVWPYADEELKPYKIHPNTWVMTREMYDRIGGYDERLSGCYGTDGEFRDRVYANARAVVTLPEVMIRYPREIIPDASTVGLTRKGDPDNDNELIRRRQERAGIAGWKPLRLTFPWKQVAEVKREPVLC